MNVFEQVKTQNDVGVDLLVHGSFEEARMVFQDSLVIVKEASLGWTEPLAALAQDPARPSALEENAFSVSALPIICFQDMDTFVYDRGLVLSQPKPIQCGLEAGAMLRLQSIVLLFNMSLTYHVERRGKALKTAVRLYSIIIDLLLEDHDFCSPQVRVLTLLALNNKAQVYHELCNYSESLATLQTLSTIDLNNVESILGHTNLLQMILNPAYYSRPSGAPAA